MITTTRAAIQSRDTFHRTLLEMMEEKGLLCIVEGEGAGPQLKDRQRLSDKETEVPHVRS